MGMVNKTNIFGLFPTPIYETYLDRQITKTEINYVNKISDKLQKNVGINKSTIDKKVLEGKPLKNIKNFCMKHVQNYFNEVVCTSDDVKPYITLSWLNFTKQDEFHHVHFHENSLVSGVFYIDVDEKNDFITFYKSTYDRIKFTAKKYNFFNSDSWHLPVKTGKLILFPSHLSHSVETKKGYNLRVSLAFNIFIKGKIGNKLQSTELEL